MVEDYQKKTKQSFSKTVCIMITNFVKYGLEGTVQLENMLVRYKDLYHDSMQEIESLRLQLAELEAKHIFSAK